MMWNPVSTRRNLLTHAAIRINIFLEKKKYWKKNFADKSQRSVCCQFNLCFIDVLQSSDITTMY